jgi:hypothetical protein
VNASFVVFDAVLGQLIVAQLGTNPTPFVVQLGTNPTLFVLLSNQKTSSHNELYWSK